MVQYSQVPEIDFSNHIGPLSSDLFQDELYESLRQFGFVVLKNHPIPTSLVKKCYEFSADFFNQVDEEKRRYIVGKAGQRGYTPFGKEHAKGVDTPDLKEFWHVGHPAPKSSEGHAQNIWPKEPQQFEDTFTQLFMMLEDIALVLLKALTSKLGVEGTYFDDLAAGGNSVLRLLHYPAITTAHPADAIRAAAHEDINLITLLLGASSSGLELKMQDGSWLPVGGSGGSLVIDTGDMMARITNNHLPSTTHRVVNPVEDNSSRYSMPFFMHPRPNATLRCVERFKDGHEKPDITAHDFLLERLREIGLDAA